MMNYLMNYYHLLEVEMNYYLQVVVLPQVEVLPLVVEQHLPVEVVVEDRTPMPRAEEVSVLQTEWGGGKRNAETGILTWKTTVAKDKPWNTTYRFVLRYPRNANVGPL